jgi:acetylglutamate kinase
MNVVFNEEVLEPLPEIEKLRGCTFVIKYGGSIVNDENAKNNFFKDIALLKMHGINIIIVHGGGPIISKWLNIAGIECKFINGLRVTDEKVMEIVQMVLAGQVNKDLALSLNLMGVNSIGLCGIDDRLIEAKKKYVIDNGEKIDIGYVGEVTNINERMLLSILKNGQVPVISPIGFDIDGNKYNINADYVASYISSAINADKLIILTDVEGVYKDINNKESLIPYLSLDKIETYINEGVICGGMIPKMECCTDAIKNGTKKVHLIYGKNEHCLINDIFNNKGTVIEEREYDDKCQKVI